MALLPSSTAKSIATIVLVEGEISSKESLSTENESL